MSRRRIGRAPAPPAPPLQSRASHILLRPKKANRPEYGSKPVPAKDTTIAPPARKRRSSRSTVRSNQAQVNRPHLDEPEYRHACTAQEKSVPKIRFHVQQPSQISAKDQIRADR